MTSRLGTIVPFFHFVLVSKDANNILWLALALLVRARVRPLSLYFQATCWSCLYVTSDVKGFVYFQISLFAEECNHIFQKGQLYVHLIELILH